MTTEPVSPESEESKPDLDKIIARIQKILDLGKRGATEGEADNAMQMAQKLMSKYNLDMAQIEAAGASRGDSGTVERVKEEFKGRAMYEWQRQLAKYVAEANFCYHLVRSQEQYVPGHYKGKDGDGEYVSGRYKTTKTNLFIGRKGNVITAQLMYQYLTQSIEDLVPLASNSERLSRSAMSWKAGCADRLCERLSARRKDLIAAHDARAQAEHEETKAELKRRADAMANKPKGLPAHHESEVKAAFDGIANDAYDASGPVPEAEEQERPEIDEDAQPWTPGGQEVPEAPTGTAMVLASVYDESEREANYEVAHDLPPGYLAKCRAERAAREEKWAAEAAAQQVETVEAPVKEETERQRKSREAREAKEQAARRRRWAREDQAEANRAAREYAKRDHAAYRAGAEKGKDIGLDVQIGAGKTAKKLG